MPPHFEKRFDAPVSVLLSSREPIKLRHLYGGICTFYSIVVIVFEVKENIGKKEIQTSCAEDIISEVVVHFVIKQTSGQMFQLFI